MTVVAAPTTQHRRMSEAEFEAWYREDRPAEYVDGEILLMSPVSVQHDDLYLFLIRLLGLFLEVHPCGRLKGAEFQARLRPGLRRLPDLQFIANENLDRLKATYLDGAPDAVFEIVSRDSVERDWREKYLEYEAADVREYWLVDPLSQNTRLYRLGTEGRYETLEEQDGRLSSEVIPAFWLKPESFWQDPLPKVTECLREMGVLS